jgi:hypothetical protein
MTLPPNIRVNTNVPFPALVLGSGAIKLTKANGVWTVALDIVDLTLQNITPSNAASQFFVVYDAIQGTFFKAQATSLTQLTRTQVVVTTSPYVVLASDMDLFVKLAVPGPVAITFPTALSRGGISLRVKDLTGDANTNNITITAAGADLFDDGAATYKLNSKWEEREFTPVLVTGTTYVWSVR